MKTFAVLNQKGGTGKTTVSVNLSARLAQCGQRVLLVDIDPQGNASSASGINKDALVGGVYEVLHGEAASPLLIYSLSNGCYVLAANRQLAAAEIDLTRTADWHEKLRDGLRDLADDFDFAFIDCPPSLGVLAVNALTAAKRVIIPMQCEYFALEGLSDLADTIRRMRNNWNPNLMIGGIVRALYDGRNRLSREVSKELEVHFGDKVFDSIIHRNVRIAEAPSYRKSIIDYAPQSSGAVAYRRLGDEFLERFG